MSSPRRVVVDVDSDGRARITFGSATAAEALAILRDAVDALKAAPDESTAVYAGPMSDDLPPDAPRPKGQRPAPIAAGSPGVFLRPLDPRDGNEWTPLEVSDITITYGEYRPAP